MNARQESFWPRRGATAKKIRDDPHNKTAVSETSASGGLFSILQIVQENESTTLRFQDDFAREPRTHDFANLRTLAVTLHLFFVVANHSLRDCFRFVLAGFHRRQAFVLAH